MRSVLVILCALAVLLGATTRGPAVGEVDCCETAERVTDPCCTQAAAPQDQDDSSGDSDCGSRCLLSKIATAVWILPRAIDEVVDVATLPAARSAESDRVTGLIILPSVPPPRA